jgi:hypothetical protein
VIITQISKILYMNGVIPNPKKTLEIDFSIEQIKGSIEYIPYKNNKYKFYQKNEVINLYSFHGKEFLSLGVYIDINLTSVNENRTKIDIEVRRTFGSFDKSSEVTQANDHLQNILKLISECLVLPKEALSELRQSSTAINTEKKKVVTWKTISIFIGSFIVSLFIFKMIFKKEREESQTEKGTNSEISKRNSSPLIIKKETDESQTEKKTKSEVLNQNSSPIIINKEYLFYTENDELNCYECDPCWKIKFIDKTTGVIWSKPCSGSSVIKSCQSKFIYKYNEENKTVTIKSIDNNNVSEICKRNFMGDWVWSKGKYPLERFYSKNNPGADFS